MIYVCYPIYNVMDEAKEMGEKLAEASEELADQTAETAGALTETKSIKTGG